MVRISLDERRRVIARTVLNLTNKPGPLSLIEKNSLRRLTSEMEELESDIEYDAHRKYSSAFRSWLRHGLNESDRERGISAEERAILTAYQKRDMGVGTGNALTGPGGAYLAPPDFVDQVTSGLRLTGPMLDVTDVTETTSGAARAYPSDSDQNSTGEIVPENAQVTTQDIPAGSTVLGAFKFSSKMIKASMELAQDAGFDFDGYIAGRFGVRLGRIMNQKFTAGIGVTEPYGVSTQATLGAVAIGSSGNTGGPDGTNTIGTTDLAQLCGSVDYAYHPNARFMLHPSTLATLRALVSKSGVPVFPGLNQAGEDTLFGYPVSVNPWLDQLQTSPSSPPVTRKAVLFGNFKPYRVRRAPLMVMRLPTRFADAGQIGFVAFWRADGALADAGAGAVKYLANVY